MIYQFPFLHALGVALINSLWHFAFLWIIYLIINYLVPLQSNKKYIVGISLYFVGFIMFFATIYSAFYQGIATALHPAMFASAFENLPLTLQSNTYLPYLSAAYLALLFVLCVKWLIAYRHLKTFRNLPVLKIDAPWRVFVLQLCSRLGIRRKVEIYLSETIGSPLTTGFLKPIILLPLASINHLSGAQIEAVILHELAHIKRFDYLVNFLLLFIEITLFFNPFALLLAKHLKNERENCCDDWVLQFDYNPLVYAKALLSIAAFKGTSPVFSLKAGENNNLLLARVKRILQPTNASKLKLRYQLWAIVALAGFIAVAGIVANLPINPSNPLSQQLGERFDVDLKMNLLTATDYRREKIGQMPKPAATTAVPTTAAPLHNISSPTIAQIAVPKAHSVPPMQALPPIVETPMVEPAMPKFIEVNLELPANATKLEQKKEELEDVLEKLHNLQLKTHQTQAAIALSLSNATTNEAAPAKLNENLLSAAHETEIFSEKLRIALAYVISQYELIQENKYLLPNMTISGAFPSTDSLTTNSQSVLNEVTGSNRPGPQKEKNLHLPGLPSKYSIESRRMLKQIRL